MRRKTDFASGTASSSAKPARTFLDTNILVYANDGAYPEKQRKATELIVLHIRAGTGVVSLQTLGEYFHIATRKLRMDPATARAQVEFYSLFQVMRPELSDVIAAIDLHRLFGYSYWDAMLLRSAQQAGCQIFLSEDMHHDQQVDGVRIVNPFL
jgi:predicted nucleic acid-binding protein